MSRFLLASLTALALSACGSDAPPRYEQQEQSGEAIPDGVVLSGKGVNAGAEAFYFSAGRREVEAAVSAELGEPTGRDSNEECGAGPMQFTLFPGGLTLNFQEDRLVGWFLDKEATGNTDLVTDKGVGVGASEQALRSAYSVDAIEDSTLGDEFFTGAEIGGFFREADGGEGERSVATLYAGVNCFFR